METQQELDWDLPENDDPPPTMRSPISELSVRDHVVPVEVQPPRPRIARVAPRPRLGSGVYPITLDTSVPTRRHRCA